MIEMRFKVVKWTEYPEFGTPLPHTEEPVLQYRYKELSLDLHSMELEESDWSDWKDVGTEYIEE